MKRRLVRLGDRRFRVELPGNDISEFSYREKDRRWDPDQCSYLDFEPGEERFLLAWEGLHLDSFVREEDVLVFLLRFAYSLKDQFLVPSELLLDLGLIYEGGKWVDEWHCEQKRKVIFSIHVGAPPKNRKIRLESYPRITDGARSQIEQTGWDNDRERYYPPPVPKVEIPVLDFAELEKPRQRRREVPNDWADVGNREYELWVQWRLRVREEKPDPRPKGSGIFLLKTGEEAKKAFAARKKAKTALTE